MIYYDNKWPWCWRGVKTKKQGILRLWVHPRALGFKVFNHSFWVKW